MRTATVMSWALALAAPLAPAGELPSASSRAVEAHAAFLASDELEGRDTATAGYLIAARYAASQFEQWGLRPAAGDGSFFQDVPLQRTELEGVEVEVRHSGDATALEWKADFISGGHAVEAAIDVGGEVVFAGYGIDAPAFGITDYETLDVRGKIVVLFSDAPARLPPAERAHFSSRREKAALAAARGAIGIVQIRSRIDAERTPWDRMTLNAGRPGMSWLERDGSVHDALPELRFRLALSDEGTEKLLEDTGTDLTQLRDAAEAGTYRPRALGTRLNVKLRSSHEPTSSPNVVALIDGTDAALKHEYVVVSAHLDHVGIGAEVNGDALYNGYYDNAIGSAVVLEVARLLAQAPAPRRSIVFLLVTGEEKGLLGSDYFARHPALPDGRIVANINVDMPLLLHPVSDLIAYGVDNSSLGALARAAAASHGFAVSEDPAPEEVFFVRSDQYSFIRQGIPAINIEPGHGSSHATIDGKAAVGEFLKTHYHRPSDSVVLGVDSDALARFTQVQATVVAAVAAADAAPTWNEGDFFGELFAKQDP